MLGIREALAVVLSSYLGVATTTLYETFGSSGAYNFVYIVATVVIFGLIVLNIAVANESLRSTRSGKLLYSKKGRLFIASSLVLFTYGTIELKQYLNEPNLQIATFYLPILVIVTASTILHWVAGSK